VVLGDVMSDERFLDTVPRPKFRVVREVFESGVVLRVGFHEFSVDELNSVVGRVGELGSRRTGPREVRVELS